MAAANRDLPARIIRTFRLRDDLESARGSSARDESMIPSFDRAYVPRARDAIVQR